MKAFLSNNLSLKYQICTPSNCKDKGIRKFEFVAKTQFLFDINVETLNLESQNQAKNIPVVLPISPIKNLAKSVQLGSLVMIVQTNRQTNRDYNFIYIYIDTEYHKIG